MKQQFFRISRAISIQRHLAIELIQIHEYILSLIPSLARGSNWRRDYVRVCVCVRARANIRIRIYQPFAHQDQRASGVSEANALSIPRSLVS